MTEKTDQSVDGPVVLSHPELMHYTTESGLKGIINSGSLWATNASFLNDREEIVHYFDKRLPLLVRDAADSYISLQSRDARGRSEIQRLGGSDDLAGRATKLLTEHLREKTLRYNNPYILSLCAPADSMVRSNGLLSQWRGYGRDGGFAIVLDTEKFGEFLRDEERLFHYQYMEWGDVHYYGRGNQPASKDIADAEDRLRREVLHMIHGGTPKDHMAVYFALTYLSCLSKHWGFFEEREVRVVAIPQQPGSEIVNTNSHGRSRKEICDFVRDGLSVPYLAFSGDKASMPMLPIKEVIVGPHQDKKLRQAAAEKLLVENGYDIPVIISEIPFAGR